MISENKTTDRKSNTIGRYEKFPDLITLQHLLWINNWILSTQLLAFYDSQHNPSDID